jgi:hypothetical protein
MLINKGWSAFKNNVLERVWDNRKKKKKTFFTFFSIACSIYLNVLCNEKFKSKNWKCASYLESWVMQ